MKGSMTIFTSLIHCNGLPPSTTPAFNYSYWARWWANWPHLQGSLAQWPVISLESAEMSCTDEAICMWHSTKG